MVMFQPIGPIGLDVSRRQKMQRQAFVQPTPRFAKKSKKQNWALAAIITGFVTVSSVIGTSFYQHYHKDGYHKQFNQQVKLLSTAATGIKLEKTDGAFETAVTKTLDDIRVKYGTHPSNAQLLEYVDGLSVPDEVKTNTKALISNKNLFGNPFTYFKDRKTSFSEWTNTTLKLETSEAFAQFVEEKGHGVIDQYKGSAINRSVLLMAIMLAGYGAIFVGQTVNRKEMNKQFEATRKDLSQTIDELKDTNDKVEAKLPADLMQAIDVLKDTLDEVEATSPADGENEN